MEGKLPFEALIRKRPVSLQAKGASKKDWQDFVRGEVVKAWGDAPPVQAVSLRFSLVYLCNDSPPDADNIIKPIQDALNGLVFEDDGLVSDVDSHRRFISEGIEVSCLPPLLREGVAGGGECVYIRVSLAQALETYL